MNTQSPATPVVRVDNTDIPVTVYQENRVITTELLAQVYGTDANNIQANFTRNKDRFEEGKHYFKLVGAELKNFVTDFKSVTNSNKIRNLILWTERGAARHAKMLDTDQAWDVFDKLEAAYFEQTAATPSQELPKPEKPKAQKVITLTQAELDALVNERVAQALPSPSAEFPPEVLAAIESRAQALGLRQYEHIKKQIVKAVGQHGDKSGDNVALVDFINRLGLPDSQLVIVHRDTLWRVTNCFAALQKAFSAVDVLEKETGLDWYSKG